MFKKHILLVYLYVFLIKLTILPVNGGLLRAEYNNLKGKMNPEQLSKELLKKIATSICVKTGRIKEGDPIEFSSNCPMVDSVKIVFSDGGLSDLVSLVFVSIAAKNGAEVIVFEFGKGQTADGFYLYLCEYLEEGTFCRGDQNVPGPFPTF